MEESEATPAEITEMSISEPSVQRRCKRDGGNSRMSRRSPGQPQEVQRSAAGYGGGWDRLAPARHSISAKKLGFPCSNDPALCIKNRWCQFPLLYGDLGRWWWRACR